jgi:putative membrane protein
MLWIKGLHVLMVMAWVAGVFYLPRIFVHYVEGRAQGEDVRRLIIMARRLFAFMSLMALVAICLGLWLWLGFGDGGRWLTLKLIFVAALLGYHVVCGVLLRRARRGAPLPSALVLRLFNEAALLLVAPIVLLAVIKPF